MKRLIPVKATKGMGWERIASTIHTPLVGWRRVSLTVRDIPGKDKGDTSYADNR